MTVRVRRSNINMKMDSCSILRTTLVGLLLLGLLRPAMTDGVSIMNTLLIKAIHILMVSMNPQLHAIETL